MPTFQPLIIVIHNEVVWGAQFRLVQCSEDVRSTLSALRLVGCVRARMCVSQIS